MTKNLHRARIILLIAAIFVFSCEPQDNVQPGCMDGDTYISFYPDPAGVFTFPSSHNPSDQLKMLRVAYFEEHACADTPEEGYHIKEDGVWRKVDVTEYNTFINSYNEMCEDCLIEHFDGCC